MGSRILVATFVSVVVAPLALLAEDAAGPLTPQKCYAAFSKHRLVGHEWRSHPEVLRVREVRGRITNEVGGWPEVARVLFQTFGPATRPVVREVLADSAGRFRIRGVPPGEYCFEASAEGWDPIEGRLEVSPRSPRDATISLALPLAQ